MEIRIIDRTEEERSKNYEEAFAEGLGMTIEEIEEAREEIERMEYRRKKAEKQGLVLSQNPGESVNKVMFFDSLSRDIKKYF